MGGAKFTEDFSYILDRHRPGLVKLRTRKKKKTIHKTLFKHSNLLLQIKCNFQAQMTNETLVHQNNKTTIITLPAITRNCSIHIPSKNRAKLALPAYIIDRCNG